MEIQLIPFEDIPQLSSRDKAYYKESSDLREFYKYPVNIESFKNVIDDKSKEQIDRKTLVQVLQNQYANLELSNLEAENIRLLAFENTFTVITAHQPSLFTGPLYYILKIFSTINLAEQLKQRYPTYNFVPIFVTGGEDHDFEEVNHFHLFGKTFTWESGESGSVGMMKTEKIKELLAEIEPILGESENAKKIFNIISNAHTQNEIYSSATLEMVHELFKDYGLVVLNMNSADLKRLFIPVIKEEIFKQASIELVTQTISKLEEKGFSGQATPREINFFYLHDQIRERIVFEDNVYKVLNTDIVFSEGEMNTEVENHPERFSPNVVIRPLYQEKVLPNLAYIGGGGELAYWLERKTQFEHFGINFPMLIRRNSAMWIDKGSSKKLAKLGLNEREFFQDAELIIRDFVKKNASDELNLEEEKEVYKEVFSKIAAKAKAIDPTLEKSVWAEHSKQLKSLENIEGRIHRAEKQKHEVALNQIRSLKTKFFPGNNGLQERKDNLIGFYLKYGQSFFDVLKDNLNPLKKGFVVISDK